MDDHTTTEAWEQGHEAGRKRQALQSNPYPAGTEQFRVWQAGWREAEGLGRTGDGPTSSGTA